MKRKFLNIALALCLMISLLPALTPSASAVDEPISVVLGVLTWQSGYYTCEVNLSSSAEMVTISVDNGYFTVPSLGGSVLTFLGGTQGTSYINTYSVSTQFQSAVFSFIDISGAENLLSGIHYYHNGAAKQTITATASKVSPEPGDMYFEGHFYRFIRPASQISWPDAVVAAGTTVDPYFGGRGYLVTVTSQAENSILLRLTQQDSSSWYSAWIGALWQRNTGSVVSPNIVIGTDDDEIGFNDVCAAVSSGNWSNLLPPYSTGSYGYEGTPDTFIYNRSDSIKYYWIDGPEAEQELSNNTAYFAPWHVNSSTIAQDEPNNGNFVYIGYQGAYWDDLGLANDGQQKPATGYVVEFSGFGEGSLDGTVANDIKTVAAMTEAWSYPTSDPGEFTKGMGSETNPYTISNAQELANLAYRVNHGSNYSGKFFMLTANIELNDNVLTADGILNTDGLFTAWTAIGCSEMYSFKGTFDGDSHTVSGIYINDTQADYQGLFGYVYGGTVKNVGVVNSYIKGTSQVGGICGVNSDGIVENCFNAGIITGTGDEKFNYVGGVCGQNSSGNGSASIKDCYNTGTVILIQGTGTSKAVGGVCGKNYSDNGKIASITNCYNTGAVTGIEYVGGVCGWNRNFGGQVNITNCYNTGTVSGHPNVGGVCGYNQDGTIEHTYFSGSNVGNGGASTSQNGTFPFIQIQDSPLTIGSTTSIVEQTDMNDAGIWNNALGNDFAVNYTNYSSTIANIDGIVVTGTTDGTGTVTGTLTIIQNELTSQGFNGIAKTITVGLSTPLTVQKAAPAISLSVSPDSPVACSTEITLTATLAGGYNPTGTVTFKNGDTEIGSPAEIASGIAILKYTPTAAATLSITADYSGDTNNSKCSSTAKIYSILNPAETPTTSFSFDGENAGKLIDTTAQMRYSIDRGSSWTACAADITDLSGVIGDISDTYDIMVKDIGNDITMESEVQTIDITKAATPSLAPTQPSTIGGSGSIPMTDIHAYSTDDGSTWTSASGTTSLNAGTYLVRVRAAGAQLASDVQSITLTAFTGVPESRPAAEVDYGAEALTDLAANARFAVNGTDVIADSEGKLSIENRWFGTTISLVKKGDGITTNDSAVQSIALSARPEAPDCTATQPSAHSATGIISGITTDMQYSTDNGVTWADGTGSDVTDFIPGTVLIRVKATLSTPAGLSQTITVIAYVAPPPDSGSESSPVYRADVQVGKNSASALPVTVNQADGTASVNAGSQTLTSAETVVTMPFVRGINTYSVGIPVPDLSTEKRQGSLAVETNKGSIIVPSNMLTGAEGAEGNRAQISIGEGDKSIFSETVKAAIGDKPLVQLTLSIDGRQTDWSNPTAPVTVSIPYNPTAEELKNPESIVIWYIDGSGNVVTIPDGRYDSRTGMVTFSTTHFSNYAVAYNKVQFSDVAPDAWYYKAVSFIAAREIANCTSNENYSPKAKLTRGEFIVLMMKTYGISPDTNPADNFSDAGDTYYTGYLSAAKRLGITSGVGNNMYAPDKEITRQEMFTLLYHALKVIDQLPAGDSGKMLSDFTDAEQVDAWAQDAMVLLVKAGTVRGSAGKLTPLSATNRAEMAQVLYNLLKK